MLSGAINIDGVVSAQLCTRCGACHGACPNNSIEWDDDFFPYTTSSCNECKTCLNVCSGIGIDFPKYSKEHFGKARDFTSNALGSLLYSEAVYSTDEEIRNKGSSGGLASQILISLLKQNKIDGAVVTGFHSSNPLVPVAKIAKNRDEIIWGAQSKYVLFPVAHIYSEIIKNPGRYAVVGLPCQLHSLIKWQNINSNLHDRIELIIGLCCHANLEPVMLRDLLAVKRILPDEIKKFEFRGGSWPGGLRVTLNDNLVKRLHSGDIKDGAFNYLKSLYIARRCLLCPDYSAEFADISISDPWIRGEDGDYIFKGGWSVAHVRTAKGDRILTEMKSSKELIASPINHELLIKNSRSMTIHKKRGVFVRIAWLKKKNMAHPEYQLSPPAIGLIDYWKEIKFQLSLLGWHFKWLRPLLLRLFFSTLGERVKQFRASSKKIQYRWRS